jgi:hypothetical protein
MNFFAHVILSSAPDGHATCSEDESWTSSSSTFHGKDDRTYGDGVSTASSHFFGNRLISA